MVMAHSAPKTELQDLRQQVNALDWYHTLDLGNGIVTPGLYDLGPYLAHYGIPDDLTGKTALDIGAASGFFSFEMERRGAKVTAIDLPAWFDHDFGPCYEPDQTAQEGLRYLQEPILLAKRALGSNIEKKEMSIYDLSPDTVSTYDLVFCGSMLLHLTDPARAIWCLQSVTRELAIIATAVSTSQGQPTAQFVGYEHGDTWWLPNRPCLERMVESAGFKTWRWFSEFQLDTRDQDPGLYHGVIHAWNTPQPQLGKDQAPPPRAPDKSPPDPRDAEIARLQELVAGYEAGRFIRAMRWLKGTALYKLLAGKQP
jgi:tRNA (mo5U34)-methyltransferase